MMANLAGSLEETDKTPDGRRWSEIVPSVLDEAWRYAISISDSDPGAWRWANHHRTAAKHPLSAAFPDEAVALDPPPAAVGGDADTIRVSTYRLARTDEFPVAALSVYRQVVDFADPEHPSWVIPGGASGVPASQHYADQLDDWAAARRIPAYFTRDDVTRNAPIEIELVPGE
jgi:penicillin amidase